MANLDRWNRVKQPPVSALKAITAGNLKGKSDISPQWRLQAMTEEYGEIGVGWYYNIEKVWNVPGAKEEVMMFVQVHLYTKDDSTTTGWSAPICGQGGSMLINSFSSGLKNNDEAFKMAVTDALGVAMKQLGFAADIYLGLFDGSKYLQPSVKASSSKPSPKSEVTPKAGMKSVDEEFKSKETADAGKLTKEQLRKENNGEHIKTIAESVEGTTEKDVVIAIGRMPGDKYSIQEVIEFIKGEKE